jgi:hypothetical protein
MNSDLLFFSKKIFKKKKMALIKSLFFYKHAQTKNIIDKQEVRERGSGLSNSLAFLDVVQEMDETSKSLSTSLTSKPVLGGRATLFTFWCFDSPRDA